MVSDEKEKELVQTNPEKFLDVAGIPSISNQFISDFLEIAEVANFLNDNNFI